MQFKNDMSPKCRICLSEDESAMDIQSCKESLAKQNHKGLHGFGRRKVHSDLC